MRAVPAKSSREPDGVLAVACPTPSVTDCGLRPNTGRLPGQLLSERAVGETTLLRLGSWLVSSRTCADSESRFSKDLELRSSGCGGAGEASDFSSW